MTVETEITEWINAWTDDWDRFAKKTLSAEVRFGY